MSMSNQHETDMLKLEFQNIDAAGIGNAGGLRGSTAAGSWYLSLHTAYPGEGGTQSTSETTRAGYARKAVARDTTNWTVSGNQVSNALDIDFAQITDAGSTDIFYCCIGDDVSGGGKLRYIAFVGNITSRLAFTAKADDTLTVPGHALSVDHRVMLIPEPGATLPAGVTEGTVYFVRAVSGNDITLSTTSGGATVDLTGVGAGFIGRVVPLVLTQNAIPRLVAGAIVVQKG